MEVLVTASYCTLLLCIVLFAFGLIIEIWAIGLSFTSPEPLIVKSAVAWVTLMSLAMVIFVGTTLHAFARDDSPFNTPVTKCLRQLPRLLKNWASERRMWKALT